jgi:vacuolar-type H+-ATPase subunit F/Vma7
MKPEIIRTVDVFLEGAEKPLIVVLGSLISEKMTFSDEIAKHVDGEMINADEISNVSEIVLSCEKVPVVVSGSLSRVESIINDSSSTVLIFGVEHSGDLKKQLSEYVDERVEEWIEEASDPVIIHYLSELESSGSEVDPDQMKEMLKRKLVTKIKKEVVKQMSSLREDKRIRWISISV